MYKNGDFLYYYVVSNNPTIDPRDIVTYEKISEHDLLIEYKNGNKEIFDTFANTRRSVVEESKKVSDEQTRVFFRKKLQMLMNRAWVNQSELASRVKTSQQMISRYLTEIGRAHV